MCNVRLKVSFYNLSGTEELVLSLASSHPVPLPLTAPVGILRVPVPLPLPAPVGIPRAPVHLPLPAPAGIPRVPVQCPC